MSLFIANLAAVTDPKITALLKIGTLVGSAISAIAGAIILSIAPRKKND
jgi:Na+/H+ antiporter NhaA